MAPSQRSPFLAGLKVVSWESCEALAKPRHQASPSWRPFWGRGHLILPGVRDPSLPRAIWLSGTSFVSCTQWPPYKLACYRFTKFWVLPVAATGFADTAHCLDIPHPDSGTQWRCGPGSLLSLGRITELHSWRGYKELFSWHTSPENRHNWEKRVTCAEQS